MRETQKVNPKGQDPTHLSDENFEQSREYFLCRYFFKFDFWLWIQVTSLLLAAATTTSRIVRRPAAKRASLKPPNRQGKAKKGRRSPKIKKRPPIINEFDILWDVDSRLKSYLVASPKLDFSGRKKNKTSSWIEDELCGVGGGGKKPLEKFEISLSPEFLSRKNRELWMAITSTRQEISATTCVAYDVWLLDCAILLLQTSLLLKPNQIWRIYFLLHFSPIRFHERIECIRIDLHKQRKIRTNSEIPKSLLLIPFL